jgi:hypothetical protein
MEGKRKIGAPRLSPPPARRTDAAASRFGILHSILWNSCCGWTFG